MVKAIGKYLIVKVMHFQMHSISRTVRTDSAVRTVRTAKSKQ